MSQCPRLRKFYVPVDILDEKLSDWQRNLCVYCLIKIEGFCWDDTRDDLRKRLEASMIPCPVCQHTRRHWEESQKGAKSYLLKNEDGDWECGMGCGFRIYQIPLSYAEKGRHS